MIKIFQCLTCRIFTGCASGSTEMYLINANPAAKTGTNPNIVNGFVVTPIANWATCPMAANMDIIQF